MLRPDSYTGHIIWTISDMNPHNKTASIPTTRPKPGTAVATPPLLDVLVLVELVLVLCPVTVETDSPALMETLALVCVL